ncbi:hypothetical protein NLJ89_g8749 [Agrocybe chaxingu]|uniref:Uncharacterized protein n=1 Tax=Agrocybe chaxingu TaxID=84603 RepID=A0A9W8MU72_9AGAR|nr:hypothetical protein NLJ89_g8749 [Agrocybe chaxingu]
MTGSATLKRLIVISFDPRPPNFLFDHLTQRFVGLEALYVVMLTAVYSKQSLEDCATFLSRLGNLEKITLMAASTDVADETLDEDDIAERWGKACPRLRVIILPRGKVWFQDEPVPGIWAGQQIIRLGSPILGSV